MKCLQKMAEVNFSFRSKCSVVNININGKIQIKWPLLRIQKDRRSY